MNKTTTLLLSVLFVPSLIVYMAKKVGSNSLIVSITEYETTPLYETKWHHVLFNPTSGIKTKLSNTCTYVHFRISNFSLKEPLACLPYCKKVCRDLKNNLNDILIQKKLIKN